MKILFFTQYLAIGGPIRQLSSLADRLNSRGHQVTVLAIHETSQNWKLVWRADSVKVESIYSHGSKKTLIWDAIHLIEAVAKLRAILKRGDFQLLCTFSGDVSRFVAWLATRNMSHVKLVWGSRGAGYRSRTEWRSALLFHLNKLASASVPLLIVNSDAGSAFYKTEGYRCTNQLVIYNGIDTDEFRPHPESRKRVRSGWGVENERLIGVVAYLGIYKGHPNFLASAAKVAKQMEDVCFVIVGAGPNSSMKKLQLLSGQLGLDERIIWAGERQDMAEVYNALDIVCSPSYEGETFSNSIAEAMSCGVPCVVTDVGDSSKIVGDQGIVVPPGDPDALANGLREMLSKLDQIDPIGIRGRILEFFTIDKMVDKTEEGLKNILR